MTSSLYPPFHYNRSHACARHKVAETLMRVRHSLPLFVIAGGYVMYVDSEC